MLGGFEHFADLGNDAFADFLEAEYLFENGLLAVLLGVIANPVGYGLLAGDAGDFGKFAMAFTQVVFDEGALYAHIHAHVERHVLVQNV